MDILSIDTIPGGVYNGCHTKGVTMGAIDDILGTLTDDAPVSDIRVCAFWTAVVSGDGVPRCGLASTLHPGQHAGRTLVPQSGDLLQQSALQLAELVRSQSPLEASIGMAAVNSLITVDTASCVQVNGGDLAKERGHGKKIAVVGHFPFVAEFRKIAQTCWVLEQRPQPGDLPADRAADILPQADVVVLTGTSVMNHTFDELMSLCSPDAFVVALGPSTPLSPVLFDYGVDVIAGLSGRRYRYYTAIHQPGGNVQTSAGCEVREHARRSIEKSTNFVGLLRHSGEENGC